MTEETSSRKISFEEAESNIGKKVMKIRVVKKNGGERASKPFKSGFKINTIKNVVMHPIRNCPAYTFEEDDSYVSAEICEIVN